MVYPRIVLLQSIFVLFWLSNTHSLHASKGKIIYLEQKNPKRKVTKIIKDPSKLPLAPKDPIYLFNFGKCKDRTFTHWSLVGPPLMVIMPPKTKHTQEKNTQEKTKEEKEAEKEKNIRETTAYMWIQEKEETPENHDPKVFVKDRMNRLRYFLNTGHDLIIPYPKKKKLLSNFFLKTSPSEKYHNKEVQQDIFQTLSPEIFNTKVSRLFQEGLNELSLEAEDVQVLKAPIDKEGEPELNEEATAYLKAFTHFPEKKPPPPNPSPTPPEEPTPLSPTPDPQPIQEPAPVDPPLQESPEPTQQEIPPITPDKEENKPLTQPTPPPKKPSIIELDTPVEDIIEDPIDTNITTTPPPKEQAPLETSPPSSSLEPSPVTTKKNNSLIIYSSLGVPIAVFALNKSRSKRKKTPSLQLKTKKRQSQVSKDSKSPSVKKERSTPQEVEATPQGENEAPLVFQEIEENLKKGEV